MGKPIQGNTWISPIYRGGQLGELKHLSTRRKRKRSDSLSSGERKGNSLNLLVRKSLHALYERGSGAQLEPSADGFEKLQNPTLAEFHWKGKP